MFDPENIQGPSGETYDDYDGLVFCRQEAVRLLADYGTDHRAAGGAIPFPCRLPRLIDAATRAERVMPGATASGVSRPLDKKSFLDFRTAHFEQTGELLSEDSGMRFSYHRNLRFVFATPRIKSTSLPLAIYRSWQALSEDGGNMLAFL